MGDMRNTHRILFGNLKGRQNLEFPGVLRWVFEKYCKVCMSVLGPKPILETRDYIYETPWVHKW